MEKVYRLEVVTGSMWRIVLDIKYDSGHKHTELIKLIHNKEEGEAEVDKLNTDLG